MAEELRITDPEAKRLLIARLARIEGQIRGLQEMIEREENCEQIAQQVTAVRSAVGKVFTEMVVDELQELETENNTNGQTHRAQLAALAKLLSRYSL